MSERPVPKSRGAKEQMSDLESTLPSGIRQNRDQVGYVPLAELKDRAQAETIKKSEIAKLMQRYVFLTYVRYVLCKVRVIQMYVLLHSG